MSTIEEVSTESLRESGFSLHENGNFAQAERTYREVLLRTPGDGEVTYALGVLAVQTGRYQMAVDNLTAVIAAGATADTYDYLGSALHGLSRLDDALQNHERAIALNPAHAAAHINRGHVLRALGRQHEALASFDRAIAIRPQILDSYISRADLLRELNRPLLALAAYDEAIALAPDCGPLHTSRGALQLQLQRWEDALANAEKAIGLGDYRPEAFVTLGLAQSAAGRAGQALASFDRALDFKPGYAPALINRGNTLRRLNRFEEALASHEQALDTVPDSFEALAGSAAALADLGRFDEAMLALDRALEMRPERAAELDLHRASALGGLERFDDMLQCCDRAVASRPGDAESLTRRAVALHKLGRSSDALSDCDTALALAPALAEARVVRGAALRELKRIRESIEAFSVVAAQRPDDALTRFALGCLYLLDGNFPRGWSLYSDNGWAGKADTKAAVREYPQPIWRGDADIAGRTIYLYPDQGLGDTIQFARYALLAQTRGASVVLSVQNGLRRLMSSLSAAIRVVDEFAAPTEFDFHAPLSALPGAFGTSVDTVPAAVPYLHADPARTVSWREKLGANGFKIGICWQGSLQKNGRGRSFALRELRRLASMPDVRLISLQKYAGTEQIDRLPAGMAVESLGAEFDAGPDGFLDTAAVMQNLDLIITCDTSIAHLAGALGRPAWVALKYIPDWRWMLDRDDSPWYPTLRLFRQFVDGDWCSVFDAMHRALSRQVIRT